MTTTQVKLDPEIAATIKALKQAHARSGAPGQFLALLPDSGQYFVQLQHGTQKFRYSVHDGKLTVRCRWSIAGSEQVKQATVKI